MTAAHAPHHDGLDQPVAGALLRWTLALADTKHKIGICTSAWINGAPALEAAVAAAAITQDELGHARSLFALLRDFPGAPSGIGAENDLQARDLYYCPRPLNDAWSSWFDVIAVNVLLDRTLNIAVAAVRDATFAPWRARAGKILQEETFHRRFGDAWLARLAHAGARPRRLMQAAIHQFWPTAAAWFGPDDDAISALLLQQGILTASPAQMRRHWLEQVTLLLEKNALTIPPHKPDWSGWNDRHRDIQGD